MEITKNNLIRILQTDKLRTELFELLVEDKNDLTLFNHIGAIAENIECSENDFKKLFVILENEGKAGQELIELFVINPIFPEELLYKLFEQDRCICDRAHRRGPIELLLKIAREKDEWSEAIITCGYYYYEQENISIEYFENFLEEFISCYSLLYHLTYKAAYNQNDKNNSILKVISKSNFEVELNELYREFKISIELENTNNVEYIKEKYLLNNPKFMKAISQNINCPQNLLKELLIVNNVKNAKTIRNNTNYTLKRQAEGPLKNSKKDA